MLEAVLIVAGLVALYWILNAAEDLIRKRPCPRCGRRVAKGKLDCPHCGFDFRRV